MNRRCYSFMAAVLFISFSLLQSACTKIENWLEGEDNIEQPKALAKIDTRQHAKKIWYASVGSVSNPKLQLTPVKVDHLIITAAENGVVTALQQQSGKIVWQVTVRDKFKRQDINSGLAVQDQHLVLTTADAKLVSLNTSNGAKQWQVALPHEALARPTIANNKVLVKTVDDKVTAYQLSDGAKLWQYAHDHVAFGVYASSAPQVVGDKVIVGFQDGKLDILDLATGRLIWQRTISIPKGVSQADRVTGLVSDPIIANGVIYVPSYHGAVTAVELANGREIWQQPMSVYAGIALDNTTLYAVDTQGHVWALSRHDGRVLWTQEELRARRLTKPVLVGNAVIVGDHEGHLHVLSRDKGHFLGRIKVSTAAITVPPFVDAGNFYVSHDGVLTHYVVSQ